MSAVRLPFNGERLARVICFAVVAAVHILLLCFLIFDIKVAQILPDPPVAVMKLVDVQEYTPPPPPPSVAQPVRSTAETVAEEIVGAEELEPQVEASVPAATENNTGSIGESSTEPEYLPQHKISELPQFDEKELQRRTVYPPIAQRSGIEGSVVLDLFIDRAGYVRNIVVLKETPEDKGFAEAAVKAFQGIRVLSPAQANGEAVAAHYRRPVRFTLR
ncbi:MAG: energy transducer TonB [Spirochaetaceae bacterium]|jgi:protein TonB|nr:energy transducer TonB [Spirochaetaceae bacterium]